MQVRHSRRCRPFRVDGGGGFKVQFCANSQLGPKLLASKVHLAYSADNTTAFPTLAHHISCAGANFPACDATDLGSIPAVSCPYIEAGIQRITQAQRRVGVLVLTAKRLRNKQCSILE